MHLVPVRRRRNGHEEMVKYLFNTSKEAVFSSPAAGNDGSADLHMLRKRRTVKKACQETKAEFRSESRNKRGFDNEPSAFSKSEAASLTSSSKTHFPLFSQVPQAIQPRIALFPILINSVSIPSF
jgi:hypothetical protein